MRTSLRLTTGAAVLGVASIVGAPAALAQTVTCDAYSEGCETAEVLPDAITRGSAGTTAGVASTGASRSGASPSSLPFTGGETAALSLAGAGALAAGVVLVVAGRRRASTSA
jgi:hypothetical protein